MPSSFWELELPGIRCLLNADLYPACLLLRADVDVLLQTGFAEPAATMTIGQMSEIFMLLIPFFCKAGHQNHDPDRHGLLGHPLMRCLPICTGSSRLMLLLAVALYGIC